MSPVAPTIPSQAASEIRKENLRAMIVMIIGVGAFSFMDAGLKVLSPHYSPFQVTALRGLSSLPIVIVWVAFSGGFGQLVRVRFPLHIFRGLVGVFMLAGFTFALRHIPLSEAYAIFFIAPLLIMALSVPILGERVSPSRWFAIGVGMAGAFIILRPTGTAVLTLAGLAVLGAAVGYALTSLAVRVLGRTDSTESMVFWLMLLMGGGSFLIALPDWRPIVASHWMVIAGIAVTGSLGQWAITEAFRRGQASFIAPFEYTALAWGAGLDWLVWHDLPGLRTFLGAGIIIASGIYLIRNEKVPLDPDMP